MSETKHETYNQLELKQTQNIECKMQHTNTNTTMLCTTANQLIEIVNEFCD